MFRKVSWFPYLSVSRFFSVFKLFTCLWTFFIYIFYFGLLLISWFSMLLFLIFKRFIRILDKIISSSLSLELLFSYLNKLDFLSFSLTSYYLSHNPLTPCRSLPDCTNIISKILLFCRSYYIFNFITDFLEI